jgi:hypothetical protein
LEQEDSASENIVELVRIAVVFVDAEEFQRAPF